MLAGSLALTAGGGAQIIELSQGQEEVANAALAVENPDWNRASEASLEAIAQAPTNAAAWARLAYIDWSRSGRLTPAGAEHLQRSYSMAPLGPDLTSWRLRFAYENWADLPPELRQSATQELRTLTRYRGWVAKEVVSEIRDPVGRFAASMAFSLGRRDSQQDRAQREATMSKAA